MSRATLKLTKPIDRNAPPKAPTSRARRALQGKARPQTSSAAPPAGPSPPPMATAHGPSAQGHPSARRSKSPDAGACRAEPAPTDARQAAAVSKAMHRAPAGPSARRRATTGTAPSPGTVGQTQPGFAPGGRRTDGAPAKHAPGTKVASAHGARSSPSLRMRPAASASSSRPPPERAAAMPVPARPPRHGNPDDPRLSKRMSELGLCSRREADEWIENGWVKVDGVAVATLGVRVSPHARIDIDPAAAQHQSEQVTILLNKPIGYVSGQAEHGYEPAMVLIKPENRWADDPSPTRFRPGHLRGLAPAGRLDIDSTGLIVFTQDGRIAKRLIGRDSEVEKEYLVRVEGTLTDEGMRLLQHGLELDGVKLKPARVSWQNEDQLRFALREGRKRQIRRMCETVGLVVTGLKRVRSGGVPLGPLPVGQWRYLRRDEKF
jgi:23S rRNA pseudouridine2604 synthase